ncbi:hypothetical protein [Microvirga sp. 2TAF3]|uniref:hypothetical protein n=1 Tax=Microvirga sp. 2TAF3 TaxID=3233014 RepID=UPI003F9957EF
MINGLSGLAPVAAAFFVAACVLWLVWRGFRRLLQSPGADRQEPQFTVQVESGQARREPALGPAQATAPSIPDAADVLALKASIDALTKQIAALEKRLAPANSNIPATDGAPPAAARTRQIDALCEVPLIVPERRR